MDAIRKLRIKEGDKVLLLAAGENEAYLADEMPAGVKVSTGTGKSSDVVIFFARDFDHVKATFQKAIDSVAPGGLLWVAYPKKSSGINSDLAGSMDSMAPWNWMMAHGWDIVSSVSIDDTWTGMRMRPKGEKKERPASEKAQVKTNAKTGERTLLLPKDFESLLNKNKKAAAFFHQLAFTHRKEYVEWIIQAKKPETRERRLEQTLELLKKGKKTK